MYHPQKKQQKPPNLCGHGEYASVQLDIACFGFCFGFSFWGFFFGAGGMGRSVPRVTARGKGASFEKPLFL